MKNYIFIQCYVEIPSELLSQDGLSPQLLTGNEPNFVVHKFNILITMLIVVIILDHYWTYRQHFLIKKFKQGTWENDLIMTP